MQGEKRRIKQDHFYKDMAPALIPALIMAVHLYGARAIMLCAVSALSAVVCEVAGCRIVKRTPRLFDCSSLYTGVLLALMLPASSPWWLAAVGSAFAVLIVKVPFGSAQSMPFSPAAAAFAFLSICFSKETFAYPVIETSSSVQVFGSEAFAQGTSVAGSLINNRLHGVTAVELINAFIGTVSGPMGMTSAVLLFGVMIYLLVRRPKSFINAGSFILTWFVFCAASVIYDKGFVINETVFRMICIRLFSGFALCIAAFIITEEPMSPEKNGQRVLYGITAGVAYIILRNFSVFEDAGCFAVLAVNAMWPVAEKYVFNHKNKDTEVTTSEQ